MKKSVYGAIDLHSNNSYVGIIDEAEKPLFKRRLPNELERIVAAFTPYREELVGIVVESTYNWYWLVDGLMEHGFKVHLAHTPANVQYKGLKHVNDASDTLWLANLLRTGLLREGFICPRELRAVRDLLRKRGQMVKHRTSNLQSVQNLLTRNTGTSMSANRIKKLEDEDVDVLLPKEELAMAVKSNLAVMRCADEQVRLLEKAVEGRVKLTDRFKVLMTAPGIGKILTMTIMLETGPISRFESVGDFASYARCADSKWVSNKKRKGKGNTKNGNKYLAWSFMEGANFAIRYSPQIQRYYQRKTAKAGRIVALKAVANKLARACYYMLLRNEAFDIERAFS